MRRLLDLTVRAVTMKSGWNGEIPCSDRSDEAIWEGQAVAARRFSDDGLHGWRGQGPISREASMACRREAGRVFAGIVLAVFCILLATNSRADSVIMKSGVVYRGIGPPDRDNTLVYIWDGVKRVVVRDSWVERIEANNAFRGGESFKLVQPLVVHGGLMPTDVVRVEAGPWDERGRRPFRYQAGRANKWIRMEQAIIEIGPHIVRFRGVDGFWGGVLETRQIPREVVTSLLSRVEQKNATERERVVRFLMDIGWNAEARKELDRLVRDFPQPDLKERSENARMFILQGEATDRRAEMMQCRRAQQYKRAAELLKTFQEKGVPTELQLEAREMERHDEQQHAADLALAADLSKLSSALPAAARKFWKDPVTEVTRALDEAPDAIRQRFASWRKAKTEPGTSDQILFALAMSSYVAGADHTTRELAGAEVMWKARDLVREYLLGSEPAASSEQVAALDKLPWEALEGASEMARRLEIMSAIIEIMPPAPDESELDLTKTLHHRVAEVDDNEPTEYAVRVPPEYHRLRSYPAVVVLHSGKGPDSAIDEMAAEAARRGYILIAPEYMIPGEPPEYRYTPSEHAAAQLALRDARKRYSIDSDRVFVAGQLMGGSMAWDLALAHPDLFAGAVVISGLPAKYVIRYMPHHEHMPLYCVLGDLAPAANEFIYSKYIKPLIIKTWDITYVEYHRRGLEALPEEIGPAFDWMDRHRRDPHPRSFKVHTARVSDDRFYGVVVREFGAGRTTDPAAAEVLGGNLKPATIEMKSSTISNLIRLQVEGVTALDIWLSPKLIDFKRKADIRINGKPYSRQAKIKLDLEPMLDDLRVRGDRQQLYWHRISTR
jgi:pimeloyl-ACP methyl ester carboxylesterase